MKNAKLTMGDLGISTRPISFAPQVKLDKEALLKKFRKKLIFLTTFGVFCFKETVKQLLVPIENDVIQYKS